MNKKRTYPPGWSSRFLKWFLNPEYFEDIQGDLEEEFFKLQNSNRNARLWYNKQVIKLFRPSMIRKIKVQNSIEKEIMMFSNYLKIGWRNLKKYKSGTIINMIGLSTGLAAFILIFLFVKHEVSYDRHFTNAEDIYRVTVKNYQVDGSMSRHWAFASAGHAERLKEDYANIEAAARFFPWAFPDVQYKDLKLPSEQVVFVDDDVFKIFDFKFIYGNPENAFEEVTSIVLTESSAIKIFGNDWKEKEILGESVSIARDGQQGQFKVTGVMEDMPVTQHFHFEYLAPLRFLGMLFGEEAMNNVGGNYNWLTYVKISNGTEIATLQKQANEEFWDKYMGEFRPGVYARDYYDFEFQPLLDIHLNSNLEGEIESNGSFQQVLIFSIIGILLLLVAIINYMNLSTSHFSRRMKEIGVRKVVGAMKGSLIRQFLTESFLITLLSFPFAIGLVYWALPYLNDFMDVQLSLNLISDYQLIFSLIVLLILVSIAAGSYPAVFLAKTNLVTALKGEQAVNAKKWNFRSFLVTFQYAVTIGLIFAILTIDAQLRFIRNTNPGYQKDQLVEVSLSRSINNLNTFKQEILNHPAIEKASYASRIPTGRLADSWGAGMYKGDSVSPVSFRLPFILIDEDFINTFEIPLIAGENFQRSQDMGTDSIGYYIINRNAAEAFGYTDPKEAIGKRLIYGQFDGQTYRVGRIQGVVEDFHFESMHSEIKPMVMLKANWGYRRMMVKLKAGDIENGLAHIEKTWPTFDSENTLNYRFLDDIFNEQYQAEERLSTMIKTFTVLAVLIGCLGLVGMVGFVIETRIKEIGVRKVLGASTQNIILMITQRFAILMVIAFAVIMPIVFYLMSNWLDNFVYQTSINVFLIIMPILAAALLTLLSIGYQSIRAANVNPVNYLKDE